MAEQQAAGSAGEMMVFGLIEQADRIGKSALATQKDLAEQIQHLGEVQEWAVTAGVELQKRAAAAIKNLEAERVRLQNAGPTLQQNAAWAMQEAIREHRDKIETQISAGMVVPLDQIKQAAAQVRQNISEISWLVRSLIFAVGIVFGLSLGWLPYRSSLTTFRSSKTGSSSTWSPSSNSKRLPLRPSRPMPQLIKGRSSQQAASAHRTRLVDLTLARQGELGTQDASHKPTASAWGQGSVFLQLTEAQYRTICHRPVRIS